MRKIFSKKNRGFTLVEALVAISILMVAVVSPMTIAQRGLSSALYSKEQMIASYLAQDALEYIKNQRDAAALKIGVSGNPGSWIPDSFDICFNGCDIDTKAVSGDVRSFSGAKLKTDEVDGEFTFYGHTGSSDSAFSRKITMERIGSDGDEVKVTVDVYWKADEKVSVSAYIYNYWENTTSI